MPTVNCYGDRDWCHFCGPVIFLTTNFPQRSLIKLGKSRLKIWMKFVERVWVQINNFSLDVSGQRYGEYTVWTWILFIFRSTNKIHIQTVDFHRIIMRKSVDPVFIYYDGL